MQETEVQSIFILYKNSHSAGCTLTFRIITKKCRALTYKINEQQTQKLCRRVKSIWLMADCWDWRVAQSFLYVLKAFKLKEPLVCFDDYKISKYASVYAHACDHTHWGAFLWIDGRVKWNNHSLHTIWWFPLWFLIDFAMINGSCKWPVWPTSDLSFNCFAISKWFSSCSASIFFGLRYTLWSRCVLELSWNFSEIFAIKFWGFSFPSYSLSQKKAIMWNFIPVFLTYCLLDGWMDEWIFICLSHQP